MLTTAEIADARRAIYATQKQLNKIMRRPEVAIVSSAYDCCNKLHKTLGELRKKLQEESESVNRKDFLAQIAGLQQELDKAKKAAQSAMRKSGKKNK